MKQLSIAIALTLLMSCGISLSAQNQANKPSTSPGPLEGGRNRYDPVQRQKEVLASAPPQAADDAFRAEDYALAEQLYRQADEIRGYSYELEHLAKVYARQERWEEARKAYHDLFDLQSPHYNVQYAQDLAVRMRYVLVLLALKRWGEAVKVYEGFDHQDEEVGEWPHFKPEKPEYARLEAIGHALVSFGALHDYDLITEKYRMWHIQQAVKRSPNAAFVHFYLGKQLERFDKDAKAKEAYKKAISLATKGSVLMKNAQEAYDRIEIYPPAPKINSK